MTTGMQSVTNFLVPATGSTNAFVLKQVFGSSPMFQSFNEISLDGIPFRPSGVIIDNAQGTGDLTVLINEVGFAIRCPAGGYMQMPYPAPLNCTANITGSGQEATVVFVDYPVIPFVSGPSGGIPNPLPVSGPLTDAELAARLPLPVSSGGLTDAQLRASPVDVNIIPVSGLSVSLFDDIGPGTVAAGQSMVTFRNKGNSDASVAGGTLGPSEAVVFQAPGRGLLAAIPYDATGTTLQIALVG